MYQLNGRVIIVTGAASGMGFAIARAFRDAGANVVGFSLEKDFENLSFDYVQGDVTKPEDCQRVAEYAIRNYGKIDGLVNCAGITHEGNLQTTELTVFQKVLEINLTGTFNMCQSCIPYLLKQSSSIINISSNMAVKALNDRIAYNPSKAAVNMLTECIAKDYAPTIRANTIMPGIVDTPMIQKRLSKMENASEILSSYAQIYPMKRIGTVEDITNAALFLISDHSSWMTGAHLPICGGDQL